MASLQEALPRALRQAQAEGLTLQPSDNVAAAPLALLATEEAPRQAVGWSVRGMPTVPAGSLADRPNLVADLCKIIQRQSSEIADLRRAIASAASVQPSVV